MGVRYDTIVASYTLLIPFLLMSIISALGFKKLFNLGMSFSLILVPIMFLGVFCILFSDMGFYSYFQDHLNILFFGLFEDDTAALAKTIGKNYPIFLLSSGILMYVFFIFTLLRRSLNIIIMKNPYLKKVFSRFYFLF